MNPPPEMTGSGVATSWLNRLRAFCISNRLVSGPGYRLRKSASGVSFELDSQPGGGASTPAREYHLKSVQDDYLTCRTWDGTNEGSTDVLIAKDPKNRTSLTTATVYGIVHTYTYQAGPDANNKQRTNNDGTNTEMELITPAYIAGDTTICDTIYAIPAKTSLKDPTGKPISLLELRPARQWAS